MPSFLRFASVAFALLAITVTGRAQGFAPRAQAAYPTAPGGYPGGYPGGIPATGTAQPGAGYMQQERMAMVDPDKKLSAGDQVTIEILEDREGGLPRVVTATGDLDVPPLGRVKVSGRTASQAAAEIKQALEKDYYYKATVRLNIDRISPVQVRQGVVYLSGEIRIVGPQDLVAGESMTLCNAILKAGGLGEWANTRKVKLMRQKDGKTQITEVNYKAIIESGDVGNDPLLQDGDRIFVPKTPFKF